MNKLSKEKRQQLILVVLATLLTIAGVWYGIINLQKAKLKDLSQNLGKAQQRLSKVQQAVDAADKIESDLKEATQKLGAIESGMATGDLFSWFVLMLREFQLRYKVDIPQISPEPPSEVNVLANFPYKQVTYIVRGIAYYNDLGKFVADFENQFPYMRVQNLELQPNLSSTPGESEQLAFKMEIVSLVKPTGS
ncbi:MAG: hypothetical protein HY298_06245 [Verrucomicrobia bacterium]|nr:hypothetical protein [Verrucomicrobiota bacterium]